MKPGAAPFTMARMSVNNLLTTIKAAEIVGLSPRTLDQFRHTGRGPRYVKLGRKVFYDPADLSNWVESNKRARTKEDPV